MSGAKSADPSTGSVTSGATGEMSYSDYLSLDKVLNAQKPLSDAHDEMLFIIQHQTSELWMMLAIHELEAARNAIRSDELHPAFKMLSRVSRIFEQLNNAWDVLRTMTPSEYTRFRGSLDSSSGFQSWQYRKIEFMVGNRQKSKLQPHEGRPEIMELLRHELEQPCIYDEALHLLNRSGIDIPDEVLERDVSLAYERNDSVCEAWRIVYQSPEKYWPLYELAEKLVDFEDYFRRWRFNHVTTVERVIGMKRGTGGTNGVEYLRRMVGTELFPELWQVRTVL